jgi:hypothetical protein
MKITNNSKANQGVWTKDGLVHLDPGQTRDLDLAEGYLERIKALPFLTVEGDPLDHDKDGKKGGSVPAKAKAE